MNRRRELLNFMANGLQIKTEVITIDESGITNAAQVTNYFINKLPATTVAILSIIGNDETTVNDEFVSYEYNYDQMYSLRTYRKRNNANTAFVWTQPNYDCYLVVGKTYTCTYIA